MGGGGLYSTAADYIRFTQMILNKGRGNGNQVLKAETVATMGQNHIGDLAMGKMTTAAPTEIPRSIAALRCCSPAFSALFSSETRIAP